MARCARISLVILIILASRIVNQRSCVGAFLSMPSKVLKQEKNSSTITATNISMSISAPTVVVVLIKTLRACNKNASLSTRRFLRGVLDLADVEGVWAFWAVADLKADLVSFLELVERNVLELVGMEEQILRTIRCSVDFDEAEALIVLLDYCTIFAYCR